MGEGWCDVDINAYFGDTTNARISREANQQEKSVKMSVKNNAEELLIKEHLSKIKFNAASSGKQKPYLRKYDISLLFANIPDANERYKNLLTHDHFELSYSLIIQLSYKFVQQLKKNGDWINLPARFKQFMKSEVQNDRNGELILM